MSELDPLTPFNRGLERLLSALAGVVVLGYLAAGVVTIVVHVLGS